VRLKLNVAGKFPPSAILIYRRARFQGRRISQARNQLEAVIAFSETSIDFQTDYTAFYPKKVELVNSFVVKHKGSIISENVGCAMELCFSVLKKWHTA
jgi:hypothetical protein